jgi:hypothetical protein
VQLELRLAREAREVREVLRGIETEPLSVAGFSKMSGVTSEPMTGSPFAVRSNVNSNDVSVAMSTPPKRIVASASVSAIDVYTSARVERARARRERIEIRADDAELDDAHAVGLTGDLHRRDAAAGALLGEVDVLPRTPRT